MSPRRARMIGIVGIVALFGALACGSATSISKGGAVSTAQPTTTATTTSAQSVRVGTALTVETDGLTVVYTVERAEQKTGADGYSRTPDNGAWLLVKASARVTKGSTFVCACDLSLIGHDGRVYEQTVASFKGHPDFASATVSAGQHTDGWLTFDVSAKTLVTARIQLKVTALLGDDAYGYWNL